MEMLSSLDDLAGKVSPGSGKDSPQHFDNNANAVAAAAKLRHLNHIVHPYSRQDAANHAAKENGLSSLINGNHAANLLNNNSLLTAAANNGVLGNTLLGVGNSTSPIHNSNGNGGLLNVMGHSDLNILNNNNNNNPLMLDKNGVINGSGGCGDHLSTTSSASTPSTGSITGGMMTMTGEQPDPDFIKMFVGQVPKSMDEEQLRDMFEEYGRVHSINVLRDKVTGVSKGCCFVTFFTRKAALKAQDALHNVKTLTGMHHPIQMKPADSENRNERKLFVGMLNKKLSENDVRKMFDQYGSIEECTVLRDANGQSKGCAFVTFATKQSAIVAIKSLHQSQTMDGCSAPLVVKFADTQKEKEQKKIQQIQANLWNIAAAANMNTMNIPLTQSATTVSTPLMPNPPQQASPVLATDAISSPLQLLQQLQAAGLQQQLLQDQMEYLKYFTGEAHLQQKLNYFPGLGAQTAADTTMAGLQNLAALAAMTAQTSALSSVTQPQQPSHNAQLSSAAALLCLLGKTANTGNTDPNPITSAYMQTPTLSQLSNAAGFQQQQTSNSAAVAAAHAQAVAASNAAAAQNMSGVAMTPAAAAAAAGKQMEGPDGCNLFIYHLPQEFTDTDLASSFAPFGHVISAKVFIDKQTNLSKCFGFVSFDSPASANAAIKGMHGFQIGTKRLKVQLKKPKDVAKPY